MRVLIDALQGTGAGTEPDDGRLAELYAPPALPWLRVNMVSTADGAATGPGGRTGSINNDADRRVFHLLRRTSDAIVVGSSTARAEGYRAAPVPLVLVSLSGQVPELLRGQPGGAVLLATCEEAPGLAESRRQLGSEHVLVLGRDQVDLSALRGTLVERGFRNILCEGGPRLLVHLLLAGVVDELCLTQVPAVVAGQHPRITVGEDVALALELRLLLEDAGTLLGRWFVR